ncbi:MAG TPA: PAS domain-containing protein, partial [Rhizomicrobium sp.]|nr:PAS domain-containing protein [Rhizomicrobium sp.]
MKDRKGGISGEIFADGGELAALIQSYPWQTSPLGPTENWSPALCNTVGLMLPARAQIVLFWGPQYVALYNDAYARTIGEKHPRALGRPARENWAELWDDLEPLLRGVRETGQTFFAKDRPFYIERSGGGIGETVYFDVSCSRVLEADGSPGGIFCIVSETTERVRDQAALRRSEERVRLATENAGVGLWDIDSNGGIDFSYSRENSNFVMAQDTRVPMEHLFSQLHPDDEPIVRAAYEAARDPAKRAMMDVEYRVLPENDRPQRWIKVRGRGLFDAEGNCVRLSGTALDITKEHETREALARSEELLRLAADNAAIGVWDMDVVHNRHFSQPRVKAMFGIPANEDPPPEEFFALVHAEDIARVSAAYADAFDPARRSSYDVEYRVNARDGVQRWVHARGRGIFDENGRCLRVVGTAMDISVRKAIEREIRELNETLEKRVAERTAALERSQAALQQAQKMEAIGNLTGGIAHDFNNLLQGLTGSLDLIHRRTNDSGIRRWAEAGLQAAERGTKLTAQLLAFSRAQKLEVKPVAVSVLLGGMRELLERTLGPSVQVTFDLSPQVAWALGDETQLEMAVLNLAINARDAMSGRGALSISTQHYRVAQDGDLEPGDYVELSVTDNGAGMQPDVVARAFDPFFTTKGVGKGTGLGLSQVYGMARQAGGTVRIASVPGEGTTVSIYLRATHGEAPQIAEVSQPDFVAAAPANILIVDDDASVLQFLTDALNTFGYGVVAAGDGDTGLEILGR